MSKLLENETVLLRALEPEDLDVLYRWENDSDLWRFGSTLTPYSRFILRDYIANSSQDLLQSHQLRLMIVERLSDHPIGTIDLYDVDMLNFRAGLGLLIDAAYRRQGLGSQALQLMHEYAFQFLGLKQLYVHVPQTNSASHQLFLKNGYTESGVLKAWIKTGMEFVDVWVMQRVNR